MTSASKYAAALKAEKAYYAGLCALENSEEYLHAIRNIDIRTSKSQSVLTHTSIMIGLLGAIIAFVDPAIVPGWIMLLMFLELLAYIGLTAYLVLTMAMSSPDVMKGGQFAERFIMLARRRRRVHNFVVKAVAVLTVLLALTLIVEFVVLAVNG